MQEVEGLIAAERRLLALAAKTPDAAVWLQLGATQHSLGKLESASGSFRRAIELAPASPHAYCAQATVLWQLGRLPEAEEVLRQAPDDAQVHFNLAVLLEHRGQGSAAKALYERVLDQSPHHAGALLNLGAMRLDAGDAEGSLRHFDALIAHAPSADAHANRARALLCVFRDEQALAAAEAALAIDAHHKRALLERVAALASLGRLDEASRAMPPVQEVAAELRARGFTKAPSVLELYLARAFDRQAVCDWRDREQLVERLRSALKSYSKSALWDAAMVFNALGLPLSAGEQRVLAQSAADNLPSYASPYLPKTDRGRRMRIGILSANVAQHPEGYLLRRVVRDLDRSRWEVHFYGLNAADGSALGNELARAADAFVDMSAMATPHIIERLRSDGLDLLVETSGYLRGTRPEILKARVAAVQASYLSVAATLGDGLVDYRISDVDTTPAEMQEDWPERLVLLPPPHFAYDNEIQRGLAGSRANHALPDAALVLCCMNQAFKIEPEAFGVWMRILAATANAVLWLLDNGPLFQDNLRREAQAHGVAAHRLIFAPRVALEEHLGRLAHADLFLDTFCFNAHTTALDALWAGLPVLTRCGTTMASRLASVFARSAGLEELVAETTEEYERKALELAGHPESIERLKNSLSRQRASCALFDTPGRVRALERAFMAMIERHRAGLPPDTLIID